MKKRRKWVYIQEPKAYEVYCDLCNGEVEWSEYENHVWCSKCQKDTRGTGGIFNGPIPINAARLLGINLDRYYLKEKKIVKVEEYIKN